MDQLGGVDFRKGCYVGQEVVSRMQHRGTARTRIVPVISRDGEAVTSGGGGDCGSAGARHDRERVGSARPRHAPSRPPRRCGRRR